MSCRTTFIMNYKIYINMHVLKILWYGRGKKVLQICVLYIRIVVNIDCLLMKFKLSQPLNKIHST